MLDALDTWENWGCLSSYQESNEIHSLPTMQWFSIYNVHICHLSLSWQSYITGYLYWRDAVLGREYFSSFPTINNIHFLSQLYLEPTSDFLLSIFGWIQLNILQWIISDWFLFLCFYFLTNFQASVLPEEERRC